MTRRWAVLLATAALAGCGGGDDQPPAEDAGGKAPDPLVAAAQATTEAGGAKIDGRVIYRFGEQRAVARLEGVADFAEERSRTRLLFPAMDPTEEREADLPHDEIQDDETRYVSTPGLRSELGKAWGKVEFGELLGKADADAQMALAFNVSDPASLLRFLRASDGARPRGTEQLRGQGAQRFEATVELGDYVDLVAEGADEGFRRGMLESLGSQFASLRVPIRVWVVDGRVARQELDMTFLIEEQEVPTTVRVDLVDPGDHHTVELPDEGDVADITDEIPRYREYLGG